MAEISLCMIVKNEEEVLNNCLSCISEAVDEIIIVDTGSTDDTIEIAKKYTDKIYEFEWVNDFSAARNYSFSKASKDYIMWLDADDIFLEEDIFKFKQLKESLSYDVDAISMKYNTAFDEQGKPAFSYFRERIVKRERGFLWHEPVHEHISVWGNQVQWEVAVTHNKKAKSNTADYSTRNLDIYNGIIDSGRSLSPRGQYYYARELKTHGRYEESIKFFTKFLEEGKGWVEDNIQACYELGSIFEILGNEKGFIEAVVRSFVYDLPRGEACCRLGAFYMKKGLTNEAIYWYKLALARNIPDTKGFIMPDYWGYIPNIQLCVLYDRLKNKEKALKYHFAAKAIKPYAEAVKHNDKYFGVGARGFTKSINRADAVKEP